MLDFINKVCMLGAAGLVVIAVANIGGGLGGKHQPPQDDGLDEDPPPAAASNIGEGSSAGTGAATGAATGTATGAVPPGDGSIANSAQNMIGQSTADISGTDGGKLGCAAAVSMIFKNATGQDILPGRSMVLGTGELYSGLSNDSRFVRVNMADAQPGDIVVTARNDATGRAGHTGVVMAGGNIISNSSSGFQGSAGGTIQQNYSVAGWASVTARNPNQTGVFRYVGNK